MKTVYVGLSGGVDSSVAAALLKQQGYRVVGVYMKNWSANLPGFECPWLEDYQDAKRVAVQLNIGFETFDFEADYKQKVVDVMIDGFKAGLTPNPDILCNQEIKFRLFYDVARERGADLIATGHYAKVVDGRLLQAADANKDQTYFLYRMPKDALSHTIFPLGELTKPQVRKLAAEYGLITAQKKESMGICFVGKVGIKEFLSNYVTSKPGKIIDQYGSTIGQHDGAIFYTIGQRHGLDVGGGKPYYVTGKNMDSNEVYVSSDIHDPHLIRSNFVITSAYWLGAEPQSDRHYQVRLRHRAELIDCQLTSNGDNWSVALTSPARAITPGQSAVFYDSEAVLGGGVIS